MSSNLLTILTQEVILNILRFLADNGRANFLQIQEKTHINSSRELRKELDKLQENNLIAVVKSSDPDFHTYYLTTEGYRAYRGVNRMLEAA